jgi:TolA-binding protein
MIRLRAMVVVLSHPDRPRLTEFRMKHAAAGCLLLGLAMLPTAPARAQLDSREAIALNNQIAELRRDLQILRDQVSRGAGGGSSLGARAIAPSAGSSDLTAQLLDRVNVLDEEVRRLRGRVDEADNARQRQGEELSKQIGDLTFRLDGMSGAGARSAPAAAAPAAAAAPVRRTPEVTLQEGNAALARRDYAAAENAAREVLATPRSPRGTDANFLLAQALAGRKDWAKAAVAYDETYNRSRSGSHAQDSLLGLAGALTNLNEKRAACESLDKLRTEFSSPRQDLREPIASARQRAGCR